MVIEKIKEEIKVAMQTKDDIKKNTLKQVLDKANASAKEIALKNKSSIEQTLTDDVCIMAINKEVKQLDQTLSMLRDNNKTDSDLYINSVRSKNILIEYLPKQLTEDELKVEIEKLLVGIDISNKGIVMKTVMGALKGKADGKLINKVVNEIIAK